MRPRLFQCRNCGGFEGYRSHPKTLAERFVLPLLLLRPVRCGDCLRRGYRSVFVPVREPRQPGKTHRAAA